MTDLDLLPVVAVLVGCLAAAPGLAQTAAPAAPAVSAPAAPAPAPAAAPATPSSFQLYGITLNAQAELGITGNPAGPNDFLNFGHLFTDRANQIMMNQLLLTAQKPIDSKASTVNFGFDLQLLYGTDARYTHFIGELNYLTDSRYQLDIINANVQVHLPYLVAGGIDLKVGQYLTPLGYETIDPSTNPFYSHSYIFNFGLPLKDTGGLAIAHVNSVLDLYGGVDSGANTSLGNGDNNSAPAGLLGFNLTLLGGNLTVLALTHFGPENPTLTVSGADGYMRFYNDITATYKATPKLTLTTEANLVRDNFFRANGFGLAQYVSYALTDKVTLNGRAEVFRDDNGFYVAAFPGVFDPVNVQAGKPAPFVKSYGANTYTELTVGVTYKPAVPASVANLMLRPELRWDHAFANPPYNAGMNHNAVTLAADVVIGF
ncbi:MAG: outer membrane beta-barrel protein [Acetobacteraceae bacterium]